MPADSIAVSPLASVIVIRRIFHDSCALSVSLHKLSLQPLFTTLSLGFRVCTRFANGKPIISLLLVSRCLLLLPAPFIVCSFPCNPQLNLGCGLRRTAYISHTLAAAFARIPRQTLLLSHASETTEQQRKGSLDQGPEPELRSQNTLITAHLSL